MSLCWLWKSVMMSYFPLEGAQHDTELKLKLGDCKNPGSLITRGGGGLTFMQAVGMLNRLCFSLQVLIPCIIRSSVICSDWCRSSIYKFPCGFIKYLDPSSDAGTVCMQAAYFGQVQFSPAQAEGSMDRAFWMLQLCQPPAWVGLIFSAYCTWHE